MLSSGLGGSLPLIAVVLVVGALFFFARRSIVDRALFVVQVRRGRVTLRGRVPGHSDYDIQAFVASLSLPEGAKIRGISDEGRFRLEFSPSVPPAEHQRLRNFFYLHS